MQMDVVENSNSIFISYGRKDDENFVFKLYKSLTNRNFNVWHDKSGGLTSNGISFLQSIRDSLSNTERLILVIGPHSSKSEYVKAEWEYALANCLVIIPILRIGNKNDESASSDGDYDLIPEAIKKRNFHCIDFRSEGNYEIALQELLDGLKNILPLVTLSHVPDRPQNYIVRNDQIDKIRQFVMADSIRPGAIISTAKNIAIQGMGGIGKSVIAAALCHDCDIRRSFQDGIYWINIGQQKLNLQTKLQELTNDDTIDLRDRFDESKNKVQTFLSKKNCLIVLDDVWDQKDIGIFASDVALRCRVLVTTRNKKAVKNFCDNVVEIGLLNMMESKQLLLKSVNNGKVQFAIDNLPLEAQAIIRECGYLPLAINIAGSMIAVGNNRSWGYILTALRKADLEHFKQDFPEYPLYPDLFKVLHVGVEELTGLLREKYIQCAVFGDNAAIPQEAIFTLWTEDELEEYKLDSFLNELVERSLIQKVSNDDYTLHSLQLDYLKSCVKRDGINLKDLQKTFIIRMGDPLTLRFEYAWRNYFWHLKEAGEEGKGLTLLKNFNWIEAKLFATDIYALLNDFELLEVNDPLKDGIYKALRLSTYVLSQYKDQLAAQLLLRITEGDDTGIFLKDCKKYSRTSWLLPVIATLSKTIQPDRIFRTFEDRITGVSVNTNYLVATTVSGSVHVWDKMNGKSIRKVKAHIGAVNDLLLFDDFFVTCGTDSLIKIWNFENDQVKTGVGHSKSVWRMQALKDKIISASNDGTIRVWNKEGKELNLLLSLPNVIPQIHVLNDNLLFLSSAEIIFIYDFHANVLVQVFEHLDRVTCFIVLGNKLISASSDNSIRIWEIDSGYLIANLSIEQKDIYTMTFHETYVFMGSFTDPTLLVLNTETYDIIEFHLHTREGICSMFIYNEYLIASLFSSSIRIFSLRDLSKNFDLKGPSDASEFLSLDKDTLYAGTYGGMVYSWNLSNVDAWFQKEDSISDEDAGEIKCLKCANEKLFITTSGARLQCYNFNDGRLLFSIPMQKFYSMSDLNLQAYEFAISGQYIGVSDWDGNMVFLNSASGESAFDTHGFISHHDSILLPSALTDPDTQAYPLATVNVQINNNVFAAVTITGFLRFWDIFNKKEIGRVYLGKFGKDIFRWDNFIIFPISNGNLLLVNRETCTHDLTLKGHERFVTSYGTYKRKLLTASGDGTIKVWSLNYPNSPVTLEAHNAAITDIKVYDNFLISCSMDSTMKVWNLDSLELVNVQKGLQDFQSLQISGDKLIACSRSGLIGIYDLKNSLREIAKFISDDLPYYLEYSSKCNKIAFGGRSGKLHFLEPVGFKL